MLVWLGESRKVLVTRKDAVKLQSCVSTATRGQICTAGSAGEVREGEMMAADKPGQVQILVKQTAVIFIAEVLWPSV